MQALVIWQVIYATRPATQAETCPVGTPVNSCSSISYYSSINQNHTNIMGYNSDDCRDNFSTDQIELMQATIEQYRQSLVNPVNVKSLDPIHCLTTSWFSVSDNLICDSGEITFNAYDYGSGSYQWIITDAISNTKIKDTTISTESFTYFFNTIGKYNVELILNSLSVKRYNMIEVSNCGSPIANEQANWMFGNLAAIKFTEHGEIRNTAPFFNRPNINASENSISQSDDSGNLLFYGAADYNDWQNFIPSFRLFNKNYDTFPRATILGDASSCQGGIILKRPNYSGNYYYIITTSGREVDAYARGLRYSFVNMSSDGGKGNTIPPTNNIPVKVSVGLPFNTFDSSFLCGELVTAIEKCNSNDYWLISLTSNDTTSNLIPNTLVVFSVNVNGITHHFTSTIKTKFGDRGQLKISPNGLYIAYPGGIAFFNRTTGEITPFKSMPYFNSTIGMSFSPDSKKLYTLEAVTLSTSRIYQYDLQSTNDSLSRAIISNNNYDFANQMQLSPNGKIFITNGFTNYLSVINYPNKLSNNFQSNAVGYELHGVELSVNGIGGTSTGNLPNMIDAKKPALIEREIIARIKNCDSAFFNCTDKCTNSHYWEFGDGTTSTLEMPSHYYDSIANYWVKYTNNNGTDSVFVKLIQDKPDFDGDTIICDTINPQYYTITHPDSTMNYSWSYSGGVTFVYNTYINQGIAIWKNNGSLTLTATSKRTGCVSTKPKAFNLNPIENNKISALCEGLKLITLKGETPTNVDTNVISYQWQKNSDLLNGTDSLWVDIVSANLKNYSIADTSKARYRRKIYLGLCQNISNFISYNYVTDKPKILGDEVTNCDTSIVYHYSTTPTDTNLFYLWTWTGGNPITGSDTTNDFEIKWNTIGKTRALITDTLTSCKVYTTWESNQFIGSKKIFPDTINTCLIVLDKIKAYAPCINDYYFVENIWQKLVSNGTWVTQYTILGGDTTGDTLSFDYNAGGSLLAHPDSIYKFRRLRHYYNPVNPNSDEYNYYDTSNTVVVLGKIYNNVINPKLTYTCIGNNASVLIGSEPSNLSKGTYVYQWQEADNYLNFSDILGETAQHFFTNPILDTLTYYRRVINNLLCLGYSDTVQVKAIPNKIESNTAKYKIGCLYNISGNFPDYGSSYTYQWQYNLIGIDSIWRNFGSGDSSKDLIFRAKANMQIRRLVITSYCTSISNVFSKEDGLNFYEVQGSISICGISNENLHFTMSMYNSPDAYENYTAILQGNQSGIWINLDSAIIDTANNYTYDKTSTVNSSLYDSYRFKVKGACDSSFYYSSEITVENCGATTYSNYLRHDDNVNEGDSALFVLDRPCGRGTDSLLWYFTNNGIAEQLYKKTLSDTLVIYPAKKCMSGMEIKVYATNRCGSSNQGNSVYINVNPYLNSDLYIKDETNDSSQISTKELNIWHSPDIWVRRYDDNGLLQQQMNYNPDTPHTVYLRVRNKGTAASLPSKLRIYWTYGGLNEQWDLRWTENVQNYFEKCNISPTEFSYYGGEITTNNAPLEIPSIPADSFVILKKNFYPPNPYWFCKQVNSISVPDSNASICFLARIEDCNLKPYGMQTTETDSLKYNVVWNNNIATRNLSILNTNNYTRNPGNTWVIVGNQPDNTHPISLKFKKRSGFDYNSYGNVYITLDDNLLEKWHSGGDVGSGFISETNGVFLINTDEDFTLGNLLLEDLGFDDYKIGVQFEITNGGITESMTWDFVLYEYQYSSSVIITGVTPPQGGMNFQVNYLKDGDEEFVMQKEGIKNINPKDDKSELNQQKASDKKPKANNQEELINGISVYPNPANNDITVAGENMNLIEIYDGLGRLIITKKSVTNSQKLFIGDIAQSVITVKVTQKNGTVSQHKVVILH